MIGIFRKKAIDFFSAQEKETITSAIKAAECRTSGEVRVFVETKCRFVDALDRAKELFEQLNMHTTAQHNGVLLYIALKDRQLAIFGDDGIHEKVGSHFWNNQIKQMVQSFNKENYAEGIATVVQKVGTALETHFPYNNETDVNELPDDIVFGK
jgi:uncharacterized membrane protein